MNPKSLLYDFLVPGQKVYFLSWNGPEIPEVDDYINITCCIVGEPETPTVRDNPDLGDQFRAILDACYTDEETIERLYETADDWFYDGL